MIPKICTSWPYDCKLLLFFLFCQPYIFPPSSSSVSPGQHHSHHCWRKTKLVLVNISISDTYQATDEPEEDEGGKTWTFAQSCLLFIWRARSESLEEGWRGTVPKCEASTVSGYLLSHVICCRHQVQSLHSRPAGLSRTLPASLCWQAGWRSRFHFPSGLGTCPHSQKYQSLVWWGLYDWAGLTSKLPWYSEPPWESTGSGGRRDTPGKKDQRRKTSAVPEAGGHHARHIDIHAKEAPTKYWVLALEQTFQ